MAFASLKNDYVFREVFSNERILRRFISDVTGIPIGKIKSVHVVNPFLWRRYRQQKQGILDVALLLNNNVRIDIELQLRVQKFWKKRSLFYLAKMYTEALRFGEDYSKLRKCIAINLLDFNLVSWEENHSVCTLRDGKGRELTDLFELHIIELNKEISGDTALGEWIRLFNAATEEELERLTESVQTVEVKEAAGMVKTMSLTKSLRWIFEQELKARRDRWAEDEYVKDLGRAEGRIEGRTEGRAEGRIEGRTEGRAEGRIDGRAEDVLQLLGRYGTVPSALQERIVQQRDSEVLKDWLLAAAEAKSVQEFCERIGM